VRGSVRHLAIAAGTLLALAALAAAARAQETREGSRSPALRLPVQTLVFGFAAEAQEGERSWGAKLAIEALGGTVGSLAGFGAGVLVAGLDECDNESLLCILEDVAIAVGGSTVGSGFGAWGAGRLGSTQPSGLGAALGSLAGAAAGLGLVHLLSEDLDLNPGDGALLLSYAVTQGVLAALGSRLIAAIRD
jgi:hypothetical protein